GGLMPASTHEHRQIVKAIASGDPEAAGRAMFDHVNRSKERTIQNCLDRQAQAGTVSGERQTIPPMDLNLQRRPER
ncbi:MAG TPA: FCD domain-containing protein, partial [Burkholderiaceae bacterium]|nr:FCD domain-containing protein [Burkholderiaceae bacterium]